MQPESTHSLSEDMYSHIEKLASEQLLLSLLMSSAWALPTKNNPATIKAFTILSIFSLLSLSQEGVGCELVKAC
jgi:hypothetical protein